jgi:hypothetical protein
VLRSASRLEAFANGVRRSRGDDLTQGTPAYSRSSVISILSIAERIRFGIDPSSFEVEQFSALLLGGDCSDRSTGGIEKSSTRL